MKNIHILPTDKPSRLYEFGNQFNIQDKEQENFRSFNIYITSDDKIKQKDRFFNTKSSAIGKHNGADILLFKEDKKIILTTDQDLIKDGVQAIPDDFLEWFVKNPSCEFVEIEDVYFHGNGYYKASELSESQKIQFAFMKSYKIIIPKEEPKQEIIASKEDAEIFINAIIDTPKPNEKLKQAVKNFTKEETLEEAIFKLYPKTNTHFDRLDEVDGNAYYRSIFRNGAKWQAERMYSLQELKLWLTHRDVYLYNYYTTYIKSGLPLQSVEDFIKESHEYLMDRK